MENLFIKKEKRYNIRKHTNSVEVYDHTRNEISGGKFRNPERHGKLRKCGKKFRAASAVGVSKISTG